MDIRVFARPLLAAAVMTLAIGLRAGAEPAAPRAIRVALVPAAIDRISGVAWRAMTQECEDIWAREGVLVTWSKETAGAHVVLPLVFDGREVRKHDPKDADAFGVTVFAGRSQTILVSEARARMVVARGRGLADSSDGTTLDIAMGVLLGRVIAHEIGHAILLTTRHSSEGLMRARFDAGEVRPALGGQFALLRQERDRLAVRFSNTPSAGQLALANFTWMDAPPAPSLLRAPR